VKKYVVAAALCLLSVTACGYFSIGTRDNVQKKRGAGGDGEYNSSVIMGSVSGGEDRTVMVLACPVSGGVEAPDSYAILERPGPFMLYVPAGRYRLYSLYDYDGDGIFENNEVSGAGRDEVTVGTDEVKTDVILPAGGRNAAIIVPRSFSVKDDAAASPRQPGNGEVARIYDERFCQENAETGWWSPTTFMKAFGARIFLTRKFNQGKVPVLFVHGAQGTPQNWAYFLFRLDAGRYQPLFFYYPTGIRLGLASRLLFEALKDLKKRYGFSTIIITAHSMGGMITRDMLTRYDLKKEGIDVKIYVTLASPWSGFKSADMAFNFPSKKLPVWYDVASASAFIDHALRARLPERVNYYLFYGTADGVAKEMALDERVYSGAREKFAFDVDHVGILSDRKVFAKYSEVLRRH
jgi:pimeloyl-ACP methyl ester carboxylesterase